MEQSRSIGIDLPLRVLIGEADGKVRLVYADPAHTARHHGLSESTPVLAQIAQALASIPQGRLGAGAEDPFGVRHSRPRDHLE